MSKPRSVLILAMIVALVGGACSFTRLLSPQPTPLFPTATNPPLVATLTALALLPTQPQAANPTQPAPTATSQPVVIVPTSAPVTGGGAASPTPPPTVQAVPVATSVPPTQPPPPQPPAGTTSVSIALIALNDNGASGPAVGCGDSAVMVRVQVPRTQAVLRASLEKLLSLHSKDYGESGFYNALYQSSLSLDQLSLTDGNAVIRLKGQLTSGGVCDDPRIIAQIEQTALQFSTVKTATIYVNGTKIQELLSGK